ncbi:esterase/lipase family protein [Kitasatospora sp. NPDC059646]|uniref:esterase/lipase family protein n=1 Tax=Kitasatospora sp. NPDC059646 TaxID=3346893 RepID=UPI0036AA2501
MRPASRRRAARTVLPGLLAVLPFTVLPAAPAAHADAKLTHRPIVFVHGYRSNSGVWSGMIGYARSYGYHSDELYAFDYSGKTPSDTPIEELGKDLAQYVKDQKLLDRSPDGKIDIIAHSMGGLVARAYLKWEGGTSATTSFVSLGTPNHGTTAAHPWCGTFVDKQCEEMGVGSDFITALNSGSETPGPTRYATFRSNIGDEPVDEMCDSLVWGGYAATLQGAENHTTACLAHGDFYHDDWTRERSLNFLQEPSWLSGTTVTPRQVYTMCNTLERLDGPDRWNEAWVQNCQIITNRGTSATVIPEMRVRGCGYRRSFLKIFYYASNSGLCQVDVDVEVYKDSSQWSTTTPKAAREADRAFNITAGPFGPGGPGAFYSRFDFQIWGDGNDAGGERIKDVRVTPTTVVP